MQIMLNNQDDIQAFHRLHCAKEAKEAEERLVDETTRWMEKFQKADQVAMELKRENETLKGYDTSTRSENETLNAEVEALEEKIRVLWRDLEMWRTSSQTWKERHDELAKGVKELRVHSFETSLSEEEIKCDHVHGPIFSPAQNARVIEQAYIHGDLLGAKTFWVDLCTDCRDETRTFLNKAYLDWLLGA